MTINELDRIKTVLISGTEILKEIAALKEAVETRKDITALLLDFTSTSECVHYKKDARGDFHRACSNQYLQKLRGTIKDVIFGVLESRITVLENELSNLKLGEAE